MFKAAASSNRAFQKQKQRDIDPQNGEEARKAEYLRFLKASMVSTTSGKTAVDNLHAAAYVIGVFLAVRSCLHASQGPPLNYLQGKFDSK